MGQLILRYSSKDAADPVVKAMAKLDAIAKRGRPESVNSVKGLNLKGKGAQQTSRDRTDRR